MSTLTRIRNASAAVAVLAIGGGSFFLAGVAGANTKPSMKAPKIHTARENAGQPNSSIVNYNADGSIRSYGNSSIMYKSPSDITGIPNDRLIQIGRALYQENCASCHGVEANGVLPSSTRGAYPSLLNLGPAVIDFWVSSGRMPAADPTSVQAVRKAPRLTRDQGLAIAAWVSSLGTGYPLVPVVSATSASVQEGLSLFALNCAACHTITGGGDALALNTYAPSLHPVTATQIVEAIRTGPGNMPNFSGSLSDAQVRDIVQYVKSDIQAPQNPGGLGLGGLGPVAEGFVGLALGVGLLALAGFWVGERQ